MMDNEQKKYTVVIDNDWYTAVHASSPEQAVHMAIRQADGDLDFSDGDFMPVEVRYSDGVLVGEVQVADVRTYDLIGNLVPVDDEEKS